MEQQDTTLNTEMQDKVLEACQAELKQVKDAYMLLLADVENAKKRAVKENERLITNAQLKVVMHLLPVIDNIERFSKTAQKSEHADIKALLQGLSLIEKDIQKAFDALDIKEVQMNTFDPEIHEAVAQVNQEGAQPGSIVDYVEKGYTFKGMLVRPARVAVAQ